MRFLCLTSDGSCLCSLLLLITVCTCEGGGTNVRTWRRLSVDSRVYSMQTYSRLVTVSSRIRCADLCSQSSACHVFYFRSDTGHCFLSPTLAKGNSTTSTSLTHVYFDGVKCPYNTYAMFGMTSCLKLYTSDVVITAARKACAADGANIVTLKTVDKSPLLYSFVTNTAGDESDVWLDASDEVQEGRWVWADGDIIDSTHPLWDSKDHDHGTSENCLIAFYYTGIYNYSDVACDSDYPFVCEIPLK